MKVNNHNSSEVIHERLYSFERGEYITHHKEENLYSLYLVCSGACKSLVNYGSFQRVVDFHLPGEILGLDKYLGNGGGSDVVANDRVEVKEYILPSIKKLACSELSKNIACASGMQLAVLQAKRQDIYYKRNTMSRVASFVDFVASRQEVSGNSVHEFKMPLTRGELSEYLGLAAETISRQLTTLESKGMIQVNGQRIKVLDADGLHAICESGSDGLDDLQNKKASNAS